MPYRLLAFASALLLACTAMAQQPPLPNAAESDPAKLGWMVGTPPPPDKIIRFDDGSFFRFPQIRWSLSNWRHFVPTVPLRRGSVATAVLPRAERSDIDAISFTPIGGDKAEFAKNRAYPTLPGWSYRNQWWISHNPHGAYMARGVHGQAIYIDPKAEMVIARFASHPVAGNVGIDPTSIPAYEALAKHLMRAK